MKINQILLVKRKYDPFKGEWAVPGGRIEDNESAEQCLKREMKEETGLDVEPIKLTGVYSNPNRDPRGVIVAAYLVRRIGGVVRAGDDAAETKWFSINELPKLCTDHGKIVEDALALL
ncbi:NUDIX hydrolase [Candidatus Micrarchaeota archaeon]|nr:NUDIX hydrolase [Candidatus Micrarchaeota archaeon]